MLRVFMAASVTASAAAASSEMHDAAHGAMAALPRGGMSNDAYAASAEKRANDALPPPPRFYDRQIYAKETMDAVITMSNKHGWSMQPDSIGGYAHASQDIYLYDVGKNLEPELMKLIEPGLQTLVDWVHEVMGPLKVDKQEWERIAYELSQNNYGGETHNHAQSVVSEADMLAALEEKAANHKLPTSGLHTIDWIFIRKYSANSDSKRDHLAGHRDTNQFSVNVPLNSDTFFEEGKLWFARRNDEESNGETAAQLAAAPMAKDTKGAHDVSTYRGRNSSRFFVPKLTAGHALCHNNQVLHGISPITKGSKYSLLFFLDMPVRAHDVKSGGSRASAPPAAGDASARATFGLSARAAKELAARADGAELEIVWLPRGAGVAASASAVQIDYPFDGDRTENTQLGHAFAVRWLGGERDGQVLAVWEVTQAKAAFVLESLDARAPSGGEGKAEL